MGTVQLLLQVNKDETDAVNFYKKQGFQFFSSSQKNEYSDIISQISSSFGNKNKGGQFIHYLKNTYMLFAKNDNIVMPDDGDKIPAINLQHFLLSSPDIGTNKHRSRRTRQHTEEDKAGITNQYAEEICKCAIGKMSVYLKSFDVYVAAILTKAQYESMKLRVDFFPPQTKFTYTDYEGLCSNMECFGNTMDDQGFFNPFLLRLPAVSSEKLISPSSLNISTTPISLATLSSLMVNQQLTKEAVCIFI